jgi:peptidyl-prolyl cis-trans isomerase SurA
MKFTRLVSVAAAAVGLASAVFAQTSPSPEAETLRQRLNQRFPNGVVATAEGTVVTVTDVVRDVSPLLGRLRQSVNDEQEYQQKIDQLADAAAQNLVTRATMIRQFRQDGSKNIPEEYVDNAVADEIAQRFEGDRSKFLEHLRTRGKTLREYRGEVEENIIYSYMRGQQRNAQQAERDAKRAEKPTASAEPDAEPSVHVRLIQLNRADGETDATLKGRADQVMTRFKAGEKFADLATELSQDVRRTKGGDWGWQKRHDFKKEFSDIAFSLNKGEASAPILLREGAFILYLEDRK